MKENDEKLKIGFLFGAGAELCYGLPSGGDFAINIFRQDSSNSKQKFKDLISKIDIDSTYANKWLPKDYNSKSISVFGKKVYEDIIKSTVEQNRDKVIEKLNAIDDIAKKIVDQLSSEEIDIDKAFLLYNEQSVDETCLGQRFSFATELKDGNKLFESNYFSSLMFSYKNSRKNNDPRTTELVSIILSICQLQVGALVQNLTRKINDGIFEKKDDEIDFLDDIGDFISLNYQSAGVNGLEYLLKIKKTDLKDDLGKIIYFGQKLLETIFSSVLDYKSLIDSNWFYLYYPKSEWAKFCKISIFLLNVRNYIIEQFESLKDDCKGYYDDISEAIQNNKFEITYLGTTNYTPIISKRIKNQNVVHLNGSTSLWYDPYLNKVLSEEEIENVKRFVIPLLFTQSGTKPMISIKMTQQYVAYYNALKESNKICVIGFGFNSDDEHINSLFRELIEEGKEIIIILKDSKLLTKKEKQNELAERLKIKDKNKINIVLVDDKREIESMNWLDYVVDKLG